MLRPRCSPRLGRRARPPRPALARPLPRPPPASGTLPQGGSQWLTCAVILLSLLHNHMSDHREASVFGALRRLIEIGGQKHSCFPPCLRRSPRPPRLVGGRRSAAAGIRRRRWIGSNRRPSLVFAPNSVRRSGVGGPGAARHRPSVWVGPPVSFAGMRKAPPAAGAVRGGGPRSSAPGFPRQAEKA